VSVTPDDVFVEDIGEYAPLVGEADFDLILEGKWPMQAVKARLAFGGEALQQGP